jgi:D-beta-D-heptose 7-phosphate kinase/D-beta-D-heptose 1-phosphate adenosyltransferase
MKIFTNGCFDVLHRGHLELLKYCAGLAIPRRGHLVIGLNSDDSVRRLKGEDRPINNQEDRKFFLESLKFVDEVIIFEEDTPKKLIREVDPDLIIKGSGSAPEIVAGSWQEMEGYKLRLFDHVDGYSTTDIINEIFSNRR